MRSLLNRIQGWTIRKREWLPIQITPIELGAKSQAVWRYRQQFNVTPEALAGFSYSGIRSILSLSGELVYKGVFDKEHPINWCWDTFGDKFSKGEVANCFGMVRANQAQ